MQQPPPQPMSDVPTTDASANAAATTAAAATASATAAAATSSTADAAAASSNPIPPVAAAASAAAAAPVAASSSAAAATPATHKPRFGSGAGLSASVASSTSLVPPGPTVAPPPLWEPRSINLYKNPQREGMSLIGEGTYGSVWLARAPNGMKVALKKIRKEKKEGFPITAIREIKILKQLKHPNIVVLKDVVSSHMPGKEGDVFMCFQFCDHDLTGLLESKVHISDALAKFYLRGILEGLLYMHKMGVLHRDIKGANILISNNGEVRIADLGLARSMAKGGYTNRVVTLWYRAPELLLGSSDYDSKIDMWSVGCLMAELLTRGTVLFPGNSTELDQLKKVFECCGSPQESDPAGENYWPGVSKLKYFQHFPPVPRKRILKQMFASKSTQAVDLLDKLLTLDPAKRFSAEQALDHEYFFEEPLAIEPHQHPAFAGNNHEYSSKQKRKEKEKNQGRPQQQQQQQQQMHMAGGGGGHPSAAASAAQSGGLPNPYGHLNVLPHSMGAGLPGLHAPNVSAAAPSAHYDRERGGAPMHAAQQPYPATHGGGYPHHPPSAAHYGGHHGAHAGAGAYPAQQQQQGPYGQRPGGSQQQQQQHRGHDYSRH